MARAQKVWRSPTMMPVWLWPAVGATAVLLTPTDGEKRALPLLRSAPTVA